jgi:Cohesin domain
MKARAAIVLGTALAFLWGLAAPAAPAAFAAGAALSFSPASGTEAVGSTFTVNVMVDSGGGVGINAADGKISFDPTLLSVASVSKDSSIFNLWVTDPTFSNTDGTITFSGGGTTAYSGSAGTVMTVTFKVLAAGTASLKFSSADVLAADGQGTNVLSTEGTASYTLGGSGSAQNPAPAATPAPAPASGGSSSSGGSSGGGGGSSGAAAYTPSITIASPTHPNQEDWYSNNNPNFTWTLTPDVAGVSVAFDQKPNTYPARTSAGLISSKQYTNVADGAWYFHVRFEDSLGDWSDPMNYEVQIDLTPPEPFTVSAEPGAGINGRTLLTFNATDTVSGIDHYDISYDGNPTSTIALSAMENGTYAADPLLPGKHTVTVYAVDKAGNYAQADASFSIAGISMPNITNFPATVIENSPIVLEGVADSNANVTVDILDSGNKVASEGKMVSDETGHWLYALEGGLPGGKYTIEATMVTTQGATASTTANAPMDVIAAPFIDRFGWIMIVILLSALGAFITFYIYKKKIAAILLAHATRENEDIRVKTKAVFEALREEVEEKVSRMEGGAAQAQGAEKLEPENVLDALRNALTVSETTIQKEVDDVDKALKGE